MQIKGVLSLHLLVRNPETETFLAAYAPSKSDLGIHSSLGIHGIHGIPINVYESRSRYIHSFMSIKREILLSMIHGYL